jgi:ATP-dependent protease HslVU (ClpYQ) peptidase subunit
MTCVVGLTDGSNVYIGADRGASDGDVILSMHRPKVTKKDGWLFGYAGSLGTGQLIEFVSLPKVLKNDDPYKVLRMDIVEQLKVVYDSHGRDIEDNGTDWLIGYKDRLFELSSGDWGVFEVTQSAIGTGSPIALGSLYTSKEEKNSMIRLTYALEAAITYSPTCQGPIDILYT